MEGFTKPALTRLARKAGVKSMSDDCIPTLRTVIAIKLTEILETVVVVNNERQTKTIMPKDIYDSIRFMGCNIAESQELGVSTCVK